VLPEVGSTIVEPGFSSAAGFGRLDHRQRDAVLDRAAGVAALALDVDRVALPNSRLTRMCGVLPIVCRMSLASMDPPGALRK
jgi:hypothetical protein